MLDVSIRREVVRMLLTLAGAPEAKLTSGFSLRGHLCFEELGPILPVDQPAVAIAVLHVSLWVVIGKGLGTLGLVGCEGPPH